MAEQLKKCKQCEQPSRLVSADGDLCLGCTVGPDGSPEEKLGRMQTLLVECPADQPPCKRCNACLRAKLGAQNGALEYYADRRVYTAQKQIGYVAEAAVLMDAGQKARMALGRT